MKLIEPTIEYDRQIQELRREFLVSGAAAGCGSLLRFEDTADWLDHLERYKRPETVPENRVPTTQYIFVRETDDKIVGLLQIRHYLNESLAKYSGHIGYSTAPSERRRGYATQMLGTALEKCRELGIDRVLISCVPENEGSRRVILNNGGIYESTVYEEEKGRSLERYWIDLSN